MTINPFLKNYLVEYVDGKGLTTVAAEVEAPDADRAKTQMLSELERRGLVPHRQRGKVRKAKGLGEARLRAKMSDKGTTGARIYIPWIQTGETEVNLVLPRPNIPQPRLQPLESAGEFVDGEGEGQSLTERRFVEARISTPSEGYPPSESEFPEEEGIDLGTDYGTPLIEKVFGKSPVMEISRRSGGK